MQRIVRLFCALASLVAMPNIVLASVITWNGYALVNDVYNFDGGQKVGSVFTAAGRLTGTFDTEKADWWQGGKIAVGFIAVGTTDNQYNYTGALQYPTGYYSPYSEVRFTDLSYQQTFSDTAMLRVGIMDIDDYMNNMEVAGTLLNGAFGNTETMNYDAQIATYPFPGFGALAQLGTKKLGLFLAVLQANPQYQRTVFQRGQLLVGELNTHLAGEDPNAAQYIFKLGLWENQPHNSSYLNVQDNGVYIIAEATWQFMRRNLGAGFNVGFSPKKLQTASDSIAACFTIGGLFLSRPDDTFNFGFAATWLKGYPHPAELVYELGYTINIIGNLNLTPDIQFVTHPSGQFANAWVGVLRLIYTIPS